MKAILLNDTRSERHIGCDLVISNTLAEAARTGIEIVEAVANSEVQQSAARASASAAELVLINGEGTMHDDWPKPTALALAAKVSKERGRKVVLYNTVWQNNPALAAYLKYFDLIFCRESLSTEQIRKAGFHALTVPDMTFAKGIPSIDRSTSLAVIDSVNGKAAKQLAWFAIRKRAAFLPFSQSSFDRLHSRKRLGFFLHHRCGTPSEFNVHDTLTRLASAERIVSGRFHGTCLAFNLGKPIASLSSNTHKTEGLYRDIGLDPDQMKSSPFLGWIRASSLERQFAYSLANQEKIRAYASKAQRQIAEMFDTIARIR